MKNTPLSVSHFTLAVTFNYIKTISVTWDYKWEKRANDLAR